MTSTLTRDGSREGSGAMFDAIGDRYDAMNRLISLGIDQRWRRRAVESLALASAREATVLDLATGTGDLAIAIADRYPSAKVIGTDPSGGMLDVGRTKIASYDGRVELREGDAMAIELEDASVDGVTIAFGIRNVPDRAKALREMARVTKPEGRVVILELGEPRSGPLAALARIHVHHVVPTLGAWFSGKREYRYLARSIAAFPPADEFCRMMEDAGLTMIACEPMTFGACVLYVARPTDGSASPKGAEA
ncbi:MAG: bifunctional demethylmenaquinone methyltransferase/2-methoxy-6-polyprenyl-1,4-benzoquinol methylase UbiE [Sandaracinaceae bacterium]